MTPGPREKAASVLLLAAILSCRNAPDPPPPAPSPNEVFPGLVAEGRWESSRPRARKGSRLFTTDPKARIRFAFAGERLALFRRVAPGAGTIEVCVDEACREVVNAAPRDFGRQPFHVSGLRPGDHSVRLSLRSGSEFDLDQVEAAAAPGRLGPGRHEDEHPDIVYEGSWIVQRRDGPSGGTVHTSFDPDARVLCTFQGDGLALFGVRFDDRAQIEVCVDGVCHERDNYMPALFWKQPWVFSGLGAGEHRLVLRRLRGRYFDLDALEVLAPKGPLRAGAHPAGHPAIRYFGEWNEGNRGEGRERSSADPGATVAFAFEGSGVALYRTLDSDRGRSELCVDGACREVDSFSEGRVARSPLAIKGLRSGVHRVIWRRLTGRHLDLGGVEVER